MDISRKMVILLIICTTVRAQTMSNQHDMDPLHPSLAVVLVVLSIMFGITFIIVAYAKFCHRQAPYPVNEIQDQSGVLRSMSRFSGVDRTIIESLPFFRFSSLKGSKEGLECVVCLSRFEDCEILRLLPKCHHAFHANCIDKWLEKHSSCPLCRYKFDVEDLKYFTYTNSFRNQQTNYSSEEQQNLEFYIQREENIEESSSRFNVANTFQKLSRLKREEPFIRKLEIDRNVGRFQHKIIISDVLQKSRWSEVNSSDLMSLSSDMLNAFSSKRFSTAGTCRDSLNKETLSKEQMLKIKDDIERKRICESMMISTRAEKVLSDHHPSSSSLCVGNVELDEHRGVSRLLDSDQRRSMSEITNISRFNEFGIRNGSVNGVSAHANIEKNDKIRRLWLPIARSTIQRFASQEKSLLDTFKLGPHHV